MSQFRNVSADERIVGLGLLPPSPGGRLVKPDEVITVVDDLDESYGCQPEVWKRLDPAKPKASPASDK